MTTTTGRRPILTEEQLDDPWHPIRQALGDTATEVLKHIDFKPWPKQLEILACQKQIIMTHGAIQGGKSFITGPKLALEYFRDLAKHTPFPGQEREYWVIGNRKEDTVYDWNTIVTTFTKLGLVGKITTQNDTPVILLNDGYNTTIKVKFSADHKLLSGVSPLGIVICEAANVTDIAFETLVARTAGYDAWMYISGSVEEDSHPWFSTKFMEWLPGIGDEQSFPVATHDNRALFPLGPEDPKYKRARARVSDDFAEERFEGRLLPPRGIVYPEFDPRVHIMHEYEYQPNETLHLWNDPGYDHTAALLFVQIHGGVVYVFDEIFIEGKTQDEVIDITIRRPHWSSPYKRLVNDPYYSKAHHSRGSVREVWQEKAGLASHGTRKYSVEEGIERVHSVLRINPETGMPGLMVHHKCRGLLSEFGVVGRPPKGNRAPYKYDVDDDGYRSAKPIEKNDDAMDALRNGLIDVLGPVRQPYDSRPGLATVVSTPESRGDDDIMIWPGQNTDRDQDAYQFVHPSVVSSMESRGEEVLIW